MKYYTIFLSGFFLMGCNKPLQENIREPKYFFHWDQEAGLGSCLNSQGVAGYNPKFIGPCGDLRGYEFHLSSLDGADLRGANLDGLDLSGFSLNGANLKAVYARGTKFTDAKMNGVKLMYGHFEGSHFKGAQLNGADLNHAHLSGASLKKASLYGAHFVLADLSGAKLPKKLETTNFKNSIISYGTELPFNVNIAKSRGMKDSNALHLEAQKDKPSSEPEKRIPSSIDDTVLEKALAAER